MKQLNLIKESETIENQSLEEELLLRTKMYDQKFNDRINTQQKIIASFVEEREVNYKHKYEVAKKEIDQYVAPLNELLKSLENAG